MEQIELGTGWPACVSITWLKRSGAFITTHPIPRSVRHGFDFPLVRRVFNACIVRTRIVGPQHLALVRVLPVVDLAPGEALRQDRVWRRAEVVADSSRVGDSTESGGRPIGGWTEKV
jgi:hypothetical protein